MAKCRFNSCDNESNKECPYCHDKFCSQHIRPSAPFIGNPTGDTPTERLARLERDRSHPCPKWVQHRQETDPIVTREGLRALDKVSNRERREEATSWNRSDSRREEYSQPKDAEKSSQHHKNRHEHGAQHCSESDCRVYVHLKRCKFCTGLFCKKHLRPRRHACTSEHYEERKFHGDIRDVALEQIRIKQKETQHERHERKRKIFAYLKVLLAVLGVIALIIAVLAFIPVPNLEETISINQTQQPLVQTVTHTVEEVFSFAPILENRSAHYNKEISVKGRLRQYTKGTATSGAITQVVLDDQNNEIALTLSDSAQRTLFIQDQTSSEVFEISGTYVLRTEPTIRVTSINPTIREVTTTTEEIIIPLETTEITPVEETRRSLLSTMFGFLDCEDGTKNGVCSAEQPLRCTNGKLVERPSACGCPEGSRAYKDACIPIVACTDGTLSPECSKNQPLFCDNGTLRDNADLCGCPNTTDYRKIGNSCERILRCTDGTEYGTCSKTKPQFCESGRIVQNAQKCGCSWGYYEQEGTCIDKITKMEYEIYRFTNEARAQNGVAPLKWNSALQKIAREHSEDMVTRNFYSHDNPDGEDPTARAVRNGFRVTKNLGGGWYSEGIAENINIMPTGNVEGIGYLRDDPTAVAQASVNSWMDSPGHRANILNPQYTDIGVGVADGSRGYYGTQNFY